MNKDGNNWLREIAQRNFEMRCRKIRLLGFLRGSRSYEAHQEWVLRSNIPDPIILPIVEPEMSLREAILDAGFINPILPDKVIANMQNDWRN